AGLAWMQEVRALEPLREVVEDEFGLSSSWPPRGVAWALVRLGTERDRQHLKELMLKHVADKAAGVADPPWRAHTSCTDYFAAVRPAFPAEAEEAANELATIDAQLAFSPGQWKDPRGLTAVPVEPVG